MKNMKVGKPALKDKDIDLIFRKLEPHLKNDLSLNKACLQAQIPKSTVYDLCKENAEFAEKVELAKNYRSTLFEDVITKQLIKISDYQKKEYGYLTSEHIKFLQWADQKINSSKGKDKDYELEKGKEPG